jgi:hypothetical protein
MLGLDAAGKTTIQYCVAKFDEIGLPGFGFSQESWRYGGFDITTWDLGGQDKIRVLFKHYFQDVKALIFVIDSCDPDRLPQAREELNWCLSDHRLEDAALLVFANKQDIACMTINDIAEHLELERLSPRPWHIQATCGIRACGLGKEGIVQGFHWLKQVCAKTPVWQKLAEPEAPTYFAGEYIARTRLEVVSSVKTRLERAIEHARGFLETGDAFQIQEVLTVDQRHYG